MNKASNSLIDSYFLVYRLGKLMLKQICLIYALSMQSVCKDGAKQRPYEEKIVQRICIKFSVDHFLCFVKCALNLFTNVQLCRFTSRVLA